MLHAAETGPRTAELASLTVSSFSPDTDPPLVRVQAGYSKHRPEVVRIVKRSTVARLKVHFASKVRTAPAFTMPSKEMRAKVVQADLVVARASWLAAAPDPDPETQAEIVKSDFLTYRDSAGRFADFHGFRHATSSFLGAANGNPEVAQTKMRHGETSLTMTTYAHFDREDEVRAVESLSDLAARPAHARQSGSA